MANKRQKNTLTINLPWINFASQVVDFVAKTEGKISKHSMPSIKNPFKGSKLSKLPVFSKLAKISSYPQNHHLISVIVVLLLISLFGAYKVASSKYNNSSDDRAVLSQNVQNQVAVNKEFAFPIKGSDGKEIASKLLVRVTTIDRTDRILVNGRGVLARETKDFIVINMEIENNTTNQLKVRPVDFIRLLGDDNKSYAADVHNDPVKAEPISIKKTRLAFVLDENKKNFKFQVGEINGNKEIVEITI